jgi:hypothetical protein
VGETPRPPVRGRARWDPEPALGLAIRLVGARARASGGAIRRAGHARIRTRVNYGMTIPQVAEVYGVAVGVVERFLRQTRASDSSDAQSTVDHVMFYMNESAK